MAIFGKKPEAGMRQPPVEKIKTMSRMGVGEKEIVKQLKSEGYSFSEIEGAMMQAMKEGIESPAMPQPAQIQQPMAPQPFQMPAPPAPPPGLREERAAAELGLAWPRLERPEEMFPQAAQEEVSPEVAMEDLIENITYEKLENYNKQLQSFGDQISMLDDKIKKLEEKASIKPIVEMPKEYEDRLDGVEAKVNGLEKAFRQMLPSLTRAIDDLKLTIEEMKKREVVVPRSPQAPEQRIYEKYYPSVPLFPAAGNKEIKQEA